MRVAVCLCGHLRSFDRIYDTLKTHILDPYQADIFITLWADSVGTWLPRSSTPDPLNHPGYILESPPVSNDQLMTVLHTLKPKGVVIDNYYMRDDQFSYIAKTYSQWHSGHADLAPKAVLSMAWTRYACVSLKKQYERMHNFKYDRVICTRFDMAHYSPVDLNSLDPNVLTDVFSGHPDFPGDQWLCGSSELIDIYGDMFANIDPLVQQGTYKQSSHDWLKAWLAYKNAPWQGRSDLNIFVVR